MKTTNHFCTLFDSYYFTRGLALYRSLVKAAEPFVLYVYCFDEACFTNLSQMNLPFLVPIRQKDFETQALLQVKPTRSIAEYCWTCTPLVIRDALQRFHLEEVTYLDADLYFYSPPSLLLKEFKNSSSSVLITEHRYTPEYDQSKESGIYCVQFMTFRADERGMKVLNWWAERCLEWCFARLEDGKFGDQMYLDDWITRFEGVHVLENLGGGVAPWNVQQYKVSSGPKINETPVVFYHFHKLTWYNSGYFDLCTSGYLLSKGAIEEIYRPYLEELKSCAKTLRLIAPHASIGSIEKPKGLRPALRKLKRMMKGTYSVCT